MRIFTLSKNSVQLGDEVFLPKYKTFGKVEEMRDDGRILKVRIQTPRGEQVVDTLNLIVKIVMIIESLLPAIRRIWQSIFRREGSE